MKRIELYEEATNLIINVNGPGNTVFETKDVENQRQSFSKIVGMLEEQIRKINIDSRENLKDNVILFNKIDYVQQQLELGKQNTLKLFEQFAQGNKDAAGALMSQMDSNYHRALIGMSEIKTQLRLLQRNDLYVKK